MSASIVRQLILKDLYLLRWLVVASIVAGGAAIAIMPFSQVAGYVGTVSLMCTLIVLNIFLVMSGVVQERKDKVLLFILSLPISTTQYVVTKVAANAIAFLVPWLVLTVAAIIVIDVSAIPNGILPYWLTVLGYILFYYCALLAVGLLWDSTAAHTTAIIIGNVSFNFFIPFLLSLPSVSGHAKGPTAVWTGDIVAILSAEILAGALALGLADLLPIAHRGLRLEEYVCPLTIALHALDAVRAFALLLGVVFHAGFSFIPGMIPGIWAINDSSPSATISVLLFISHIFRMSLFFFIAGFFARMMFERKGARGFWSNRAQRILVPLIAGWVVIFPALAAVWIWGLTKAFGDSSGSARQCAARRHPGRSRSRTCGSSTTSSCFTRSSCSAAPLSSGSTEKAPSVVSWTP